MAKRPSLRQVADKEASGPVSIPAQSRPTSRQGKRVLSVFIEPQVWRQLRAMALDEGTTTQALGVEALSLLFAQRGKGQPA